MAALELPELLAIVAGLTQSPLGATRARRLRPCNDLPTVARRLRRLSQLCDLLDQSGPPSLDGLADVGPLLARLGAEGAFLTCPELERVAQFLSSVSSAAAFLDPSESLFDELFRLRNSFMPMPDLAKRIRSVIGPGGSVASSASPELARVRREMGRARDSLRGQLNALFSQSGLGGVFSDQIVTQRADRFVVPVKVEMKSRLSGIIHDASGTGATCFVEPLEAVEGNNRLALLRRQEHEEELRVLRETALEISFNLGALHEAQDALAKLDCLLAQAVFCRRLDCAEPRLHAGDELELLKARHPLLAWRQAQGRGRVAPVGLSLGGACRTLIISGANAGGKTVALKTAGLITLMVMCGLRAPVEAGSRLPIFRQVMAEIGDDQDIDRELSTFSAHATRLAWMTRLAGRGSLCLIDELGAATDPGEGAALGMAVLDWLRQKGALAMVTTHFHRLKAYAAAAEGTENASVSFNQATGVPTYQLHYGAPGFSDALAVSRRLGFPPEVLAQAEANLDSGERQTVALLQEAESIRQQAAEERAKAGRERLAAEEERQKARLLLRQAREQKAGALAEGKRRVREVAARLEKRLEELLGQAEQAKAADQPVKPGKLKQEVYQARREALEEVERVTAPPKADAPQAPVDAFAALKAGAAVRAIALDQKGVLLEDARPGAETVAVSVGVSGVRVMIPVNQLEPLGGAREDNRPKPGVSVQVQAASGLDLNLVGLRVEEALDKVDKAVDQAVVAGRSRLCVVHGVGTGRLRAAVREFLRGHPFVAGVRQAEPRQGGAGVTVAELRE